MTLLLQAVGWTALVFAGAAAFLGVVAGFATMADKHPRMAIALGVAFTFSVSVLLVYAALGGFK